MAEAKDYAVAALAADTDGTLWVAANSFDMAGTARARFAQRMRGTPFANTPIGATISDSLGNVTPVQRPALWHVHDGKWASDDLPQPSAGKSDHVITALLAYSPRDIWVGTTAALLRFNTAKLVNPWSVVAEGNVTDLARDIKGRVWWAGADGVRLYSDDDGIKKFTDSPASAVALATDGTIWIAQDRTLRRYAKGVITRFSPPAALPITALWTLEGGAVVASHNRLAGSYGTGAAASVVGGGLNFNRLSDVAADPQGVVWCSVSRSTPLFRVSRDFSGRAPLVEPILRTAKDDNAQIPPARYGGAWFEVVGAWHDVYSRFDPDAQRWTSLPQSPAPDLIQTETPAAAFALAANGGLWTADQGDT